MGEAWGRELKCTGRTPEREEGDAERSGGCRMEARIVQRGASNLRVVELRRLFTVDRPWRSRLLLDKPQVRYAILGAVDRCNPPRDEQEAERILERLRDNGVLTPGQLEEILADPAGAVGMLAEAVRDNPLPTGYSALLDQEFGLLARGAVEGFPPAGTRRPSAAPLLEVDPSRAKSAPWSADLTLKATPVPRLRTVLVQTGYRRMVGRMTGGEGESARSVGVSFEKDGRKWYPGAEFLGEGLLVTADQPGVTLPRLTGEATAAWTGAAGGAGRYPEFVFRDPGRRDELQPWFVWWHTLAHLLIRALSAHAGYSAASMGERVYLVRGGGGIRGGVLLHAVRPGSEGTLGGLVALANQFPKLLERAREMAATCSNDPLCRERRPGLAFLSGASCYGCTLLPETSCEHRNLWLDRNVLLESLDS